jgi:DNA polymerase-1
VYFNAKFDIGQIRRYYTYPDRKLMWDCMVAEQSMYAGWYAKNEFALNDLARRYLDVYMTKDIRAEFETATEMTKEQIEYLAVDVVATWRVYQEQMKRADENDIAVFRNIDKGAIYSVLRMGGMKLDIDAWTKLYEFNLAQADRIRVKYPEINLGSWQQVAKELKKQGYDLGGTNEKALTPILNECEFAVDVLEYRGRTKAAGTYGKTWIDEHVEADGRVYSDFYINGTETGRFSSSKPNVENIPQKDGPHFRKSFIAQLGYVLVDADFSAQEPRIWTYLSGDELLLDIFNKHKDIYITSAKLMMNWDMEKSDPRRNKRMKPTVLGAIFGLTQYGLLQKDQIPLDEGEELLNAFWTAFPTSKQYRDEIRKTKDYVQTIYGRKFWLNPYQFGYENNTLNAPVQGSAADIIKLAGYRFQMEVEKSDLLDDVFLINYIHDELLVECKASLKDWTVETLKKIMLQTAEETHDGVPADIEIGFGANWADAHV